MTDPSKGDLELSWQEARAIVAARRAVALQKRAALEVYDARLAATRRRRRAAEQSLVLTKRVTAACGLDRSAVTLGRLARFQRAIDECREEARCIIGAAEPLCAEFDVACSELREARVIERDALQAILAARESVQLSVEREKQRTAQLRAEMTRLEGIRRLEEVTRARELKWEQDCHYDPNYDDWEILARRNRPWL
jgi:hypothetical protein